MVFFGEYTISVTDGARIVIPKKIRENLKGNIFVLTKGFDECLSGYDKDDWQKRTQELLNVSLLNKENIEKKRLVFAGAAYVNIDDQGRFVIPKALLEFIKVSNSVSIIGVGDHFEIWNTSKWQEYEKTIKI